MYHKIDAATGKAMLEQGGVTLVDVRRAEEYAAGHVAGALLLPLDRVPTDAATALPDKNAPLLVYCRSGVRSKQAADSMVAQGYAQVYDMGGILDWQAAGYAVITD